MRSPQVIQENWLERPEAAVRTPPAEEKGKLKVQTCTAVARQLAGFIWAIGQALPPAAVKVHGG